GRAQLVQQRGFRIVWVLRDEVCVRFISAYAFVGTAVRLVRILCPRGCFAKDCHHLTAGGRDLSASSKCSGWAHLPCLAELFPCRTRMLRLVVRCGDQ